MAEYLAAIHGPGKVKYDHLHRTYQQHITSYTFSSPLLNAIILSLIILFVLMSLHFSSNVITCLHLLRQDCPFYFKTGACRHGDKCERAHTKPAISQTLLFPRMWPNPMIHCSTPIDRKTLQSQYDEFYEDIFEELSRFGELEELNVYENLGDHLAGNVYAKFNKEEHARAAMVKLQGLHYEGVKPLLSPFLPLWVSSHGINSPFPSIGYLTLYPSI